MKLNSYQLIIYIMGYVPSLAKWIQSRLSVRITNCKIVIKWLLSKYQLKDYILYIVSNILVFIWSCFSSWKIDYFWQFLWNKPHNKNTIKYMKTKISRLCKIEVFIGQTDIYFEHFLLKHILLEGKNKWTH